MDTNNKKNKLKTEDDNQLPPSGNQTIDESNRPDIDLAYRRILEEIDDGYWEVDLAGSALFCNMAMSRITGYPADEFLNLSYKDYMDTITAGAAYNHFNAVFHSKSHQKTMMYEIIRKDGTPRLVEISCTLIHSPNGTPTGFRGIMRDITDRQHTRDYDERFAMIRKALGQTVQALSLALEVRDPYTAGHHRRVSDLARSIAAIMGFPRDSIDGIRIAGSLHDIGKISIPSEILSKPGGLTDIEFKLIKTHPQMGYDILKSIDFPWPVATAVYQHHERVNGAGYPMGIGGKEIILESKILAVADVVEAMSSHRPYRRAIGIEWALEEIRTHSGTLYDADVVDACLKLFADNSYTIKD